MRALIITLTVGLLLLSVLSPVPARGAGIDLTFQGNVLSANLKEAQLKEILEKLEREKGISWKGESSLLEEKITVQFRNLSLHEGVKRILGSMNHCLVFDKDERLASVVIIGKKTHGQVRPKGRVVAQKKRTHEGQAAKAEEISKASGGHVVVTKKDREDPKAMRTTQPPGGSYQPTAEEMGKFKVVKNLPPPGDSTKVSKEVLESFKVIKNLPPPGGSNEVSEEVRESFKVLKNLPPPGS